MKRLNLIQGVPLDSSIVPYAVGLFHFLILTVTLCGVLLRSMEMFSNASSMGVPEAVVEVPFDSKVRFVLTICVKNLTTRF